MNLNIGTLNLNDYGPLSLWDLVGTLPADDTCDYLPVACDIDNDPDDWGHTHWFDAERIADDTADRPECFTCGSDACECTDYEHYWAVRDFLCEHPAAIHFA